MASACACAPGPAAVPRRRLTNKLCNTRPMSSVTPLSACCWSLRTLMMHSDSCTQHGCVVHAVNHCLSSVEEAGDRVSAPHTMCNGVWPKHFCDVHGVTRHAVARKLFRQCVCEPNPDERPGAGVRGLREALPCDRL